MITSDKSPALDKFLANTFGVDRRELIEMNECLWCGKEATEFRDKLSKKEFTISGFCQSCQDFTFGGDDDSK